MEGQLMGDYEDMAGAAWKVWWLLVIVLASVGLLGLAGWGVALYLWTR
jgi:hypothetical protein